MTAVLSFFCIPVMHILMYCCSRLVCGRPTESLPVLWKVSLMPWKNGKRFASGRCCRFYSSHCLNIEGSYNMHDAD